MRENSRSSQPPEQLAEEIVAPLFYQALDIMNAGCEIRNVKGVTFCQSEFGMLQRPFSPTNLLPVRGFLMDCGYRQEEQCMKPFLALLINGKPERINGIWRVTTVQQFIKFEGSAANIHEYKSSVYYTDEEKIVEVDNQEVGPLLVEIVETENKKSNSRIAFHESSAYKRRISNPQKRDFLKPLDLKRIQKGMELIMRAVDRTREIIAS